jgi:aryl-alcohol dehydrogenase-like predicted oxidoreductase
MTDNGLPTRTLGRTGLEVTTLGYGAMSLDDRFGRTVSEAEASEVLNAALDAGINFIDTAPDYGPSEEMIGQAIAHRRDEFILATKAGCPVAEAAEGRHEYTRENIVAAVEQSLRRMHTDYLDVVQFHGSPAPDVLAANEAVEALLELKRAGKVRFIGMSATLPHLEAHIESGAFDVFQIPYSALQRDHEALITRASAAGAGTVIRGGVARGAPSEEKGWDIRRLPEVAPELPRLRWEAADLDDLLAGDSRMAFVLRFTLSHPGLHTTIVGTANPDHLRANIEAVRRGALPADVYEEAQARLDRATAR